MQRILFQVQPGQKYYQLTHDYLVPSLRDWLTRKQKETRRGRAELRLADRAAVWNARPENRQLPSLWQWLGIRWLTQKKNWTPPQRKMMRKAGRHHAVRGTIVALVLSLVGWGSYQVHGTLKAHALLDSLLHAETQQVPNIVAGMPSYRSWLKPLLQKAFKDAEANNEPRKQLHASLALLPVDSGQVDYLYRRLLKGEPQQVMVIREALVGHKQDLTEHLWKLLENAKGDQAERFRAASALAAFAADDPRWEKVSDDVAASLVVQKPNEIAQWADGLKGVKKWLMQPLGGFLEDEKRSLSEKGLIASIYGTYAADMPDGYVRLEQRLTGQSEPNATMEAKITLAKRQASIGTALLVMGRGEKIWPLLKHRPDPTMRSFLMEWLGPIGVDPNVLLARLEEEKDESVKRAILLSLGEYGPDRLSEGERQKHVPGLIKLYKEDPDAGIHGATEWLLQQWQTPEKMKELDGAMARGKADGKRRWYVNGQGQTMVIVSSPDEFWMGDDKGGSRKASQED